VVLFRRVAGGPGPAEGGWGERDAGKVGLQLPHCARLEQLGAKCQDYRLASSTFE
jgi:hypothetical protein